MKKGIIAGFIIVIAVLIGLLVFNNSNKEEVEEVLSEKANVYMFMQNGCGYCTQAEAFFESIKAEYGQYYDLIELNTAATENSKLADKVAKHFGESFKGTPYIIIGDKTFAGYGAAFDDAIKAAIMTTFENKKDIVAQIQNEKTGSDGLIVALIFVSVAFVGYLIYLGVTKSNFNNAESLDTEE